MTKIGIAAFVLLAAALSVKPAAAEARHVAVRGEAGTVIFELNGSPAAESLYAQLPMTVEVENYADNEKVFHPKEKLAVDGSPLANAVVGSLCYFAPWNNVVMFYGDFGSYPGLYALGEAVSGAEVVAKLSGRLELFAAAGS